MSITVKIIIDTVCPFCLLGKLKFEKALGVFTSAHPNTEVKISWHPFNLDPSLSSPIKKRDLYARLVGPARVDSLANQMRGRFAEFGLKYDSDGVRGPTLDSHRLIALAQSRSAKDASDVVRAIFKAYMEEGKDISDINTLADIAADCGMDRNEIKLYLNSDTGKAEVQNEIRAAARRGIHGVPHFTFNDRIEVSGAQDSEVFLDALERASK